MELRHLRYFTAAAEELNISRAARRLNVSQPAMSRLIRDLEDELGGPLFRRERSGVTLTAAGERLFVYARQVLDICEEAARTIGGLSGAIHELSIGFIPSTLETLLSEGFRRFREKHPQITVNIRELSPAEQIAALRNGEIDLALLGNPAGVVSDEFAVRIISSLDLRAVVPERHPLANRNSLLLRDLSAYDFIGYNEKRFPAKNQIITTICQAAGFKPLFRYLANSLVEVVAMIGSGMGVCLMPSDVASLPHPNVLFIPLKDRLPPIHCAVAWRRNDGRPVIQHLLDCLGQGRAA